MIPLEWISFKDRQAPITTLPTHKIGEKADINTTDIVLLTDGYAKYIGRLVILDKHRHVWEIINHKFNNELPLFTHWCRLPPLEFKN